MADLMAVGACCTAVGCATVTTAGLVAVVVGKAGEGSTADCIAVGAWVTAAAVGATATLAGSGCAMAGRPTKRRSFVERLNYDVRIFARTRHFPNGNAFCSREFDDKTFLKSPKIK